MPSPCSPHREVIIPPFWSEAVNSITSSAKSAPPTTLICGPKNSGKSTFSRILLNSLLQRYERVGYLDADVGQPEFSTPGCLSLHVVDEFLTDLMNPRIKSPERLYDYFLKEYYQSDHENSRKSMLPLIINTPGWVKGTGFDVLVEMLRYIAPTLVVQLRISAENKNLPIGLFWLDEYKKPTTLINIYSAQRDFLDRSVLVQKDARGMQNQQLFEYFKQCFPTSFSITTNKELAYALASLPPYEVSISRITVRHLHCEVPRKELYHSLNATIVGLAVSSLEPTTTEGHIPWCVGLGIVRGVDIKKDLLYVVTPVPCENLENVDLLLQGFIEIPTGFLQVRGCVSPYMSTNVLHKLPDKDL